MIKIVTTSQMRAIEEAADKSGVTYAQLMQNAGKAVANAAIGMLNSNSSGKRILILAGKGNNGSDGLVAAHILRQDYQFDVTCYLSSSRSAEDNILVEARAAGVSIKLSNADVDFQELRRLIQGADLLIDALLGTGIKLPVRGVEREILEAARETLQIRRNSKAAAGIDWVGFPPFALPFSLPILAVDCPSGLDCDTGVADDKSLSATATVTFAAVKHGQLLFPGASYCGDLIFDDIGIPQTLENLQAVQSELVTARDAARLLPARSMDGHKGTFGKVLVVAGSRNFVGAAGLAGQAAYKVGAGLVKMAVPETVYPILASMFPEAVWLPLAEQEGSISANAAPTVTDALTDIDAMIIGPGLGQNTHAADFLGDLLERQRLSDDGNNLPSAELPVILDADALNHIAVIPEWWKLIPKRTIVTPHIGEMARLSGASRKEISARRIEFATDGARKWNCVVILKGPFTVIAESSGRHAVLPFATDALAKAGTGDVLAGCIGGMLAQGRSLFDAAIVGGYIHALAGTLAGKSIPTRSVFARDVINYIPTSIARVESYR